MERAIIPDAMAAQRGALELNQTGVQLPAVQIAFGSQALLQKPQLKRSESMSTQTPLQLFSPAWQDSWQELALQIFPAGQGLPHEPQLSVSV
jgi:hypothetical protein